MAYPLNSEMLAMAAFEDRLSPEEETWRIPFALISTGSNTSGAALTSVKVNNMPLPLNSIGLLAGDARGLPVIPAGRYLPTTDLIKWHQLHLRTQMSSKPSLKALSQLAAYNTKISRTAERVPLLRRDANEIRLPTQLFDFKDNEISQVEVLFENSLRKRVFGFNVSVTVTSLPCCSDKSCWAAGDMQIHSTYSDGQRSLAQLKSIMKGRGYEFIYTSDGQHTKKLLNDEWPRYVNETQKLSDERFSVFPGVETAVGPLDDEKGHLLVCGANKSIAGLEEHTRSPQGMIATAGELEPEGPSFSILSHPLGIYRWKDYTVRGHLGMEIFSGPLQLGFDLKSGAARLWRRELMRHVNHDFYSPMFPSPYTGTDWHGYWFEPLRTYVTWTPTPCNWGTLDYFGRKAAVGQSLSEGKVVASRRGSLGFFEVDGQHIGSRLRNVAPGTVLPLYVEYRSAARGITHIQLIKNDLQETVFSRREFCRPGQVKNWQARLMFPGGRQYYWLYAEGTDHVYTSPIFISED